MTIRIIPININIVCTEQNIEWLNMNILIVEDQFIIAMNLKIKVEGLGYKVVGIESSGETAIEKIPELLPDMVLMDIGLNGKMDGIETTYEIWEQFKIPVLYVTAHSDELTLERVRNSPGYGILIKPVSSNDLNTAIEMSFYKRTKTCTIHTGKSHA
jgi:two-component system, response regulator PdtaR